MTAWMGAITYLSNQNEGIEKGTNKEEEKKEGVPEKKREQEGGVE